MVASVIANANRDPRRKPSPFQPKDFMPKLSTRVQRSPREMFEALAKDMRAKKDGR